MRVFAATAFVSAVIAGAALAATAQPSSSQWTWRSLHRPLHIPRLAAGTPCPVSARTTVDLGEEGVQQLPGPGPAFPNAGYGLPLLEFYYPPLPIQEDFYGSAWSGNKVLWWVLPTYRGPVLIRGRQLDGRHLVRFEGGKLPAAELRMKPLPAWLFPPDRPRDRPSYTRLQAPGCYGYQVDGTNFSRVIVFQAKIIPPP